MTRVTAFVIVYLAMFSIGFFAYFLLGTEFLVDGRQISRWIHLITAITTGGLALLMWQEGRSKPATHMLCRNRVADFAKWKRVFDSHTNAHLAAGLRLAHLWRTVKDPNDVYFLFEVEALDRAQAFIDAPESAQAGKESGVIDGEYHYVKSV